MVGTGIRLRELYKFVYVMCTYFIGISKHLLDLYQDMKTFY